MRKTGKKCLLSQPNVETKSEGSLRLVFLKPIQGVNTISIKLVFTPCREQGTISQKGVEET